MEPTDGELHAGCLGNINATWTFRGPLRALGAAVGRRQRHPSRGGRNRSFAAAAEPVPSTFGGLTFTRGGVGDAGRRRDRDERDPGRVHGARQLPLRAGASPEDAEERLHELTGGHGELVVDGNSGSAPVALDHPLARKLIQAGLAEGRAQAGVDAGRRVRCRRLRRGQLRAGRDLRRRTAATSTSRSPRCSPRTACWRRSARDPPLAGAGRPRHVPVRAARGGRGRACAPRASRSSSSASASRARRRPRSSGRRSRTRSRRWRRIRACSGCRSCARRSRAGSTAASASRSIPTPRCSRRIGSKEAVFGLAHVLRRRRASSCRTPAYPVYDRGARVRRQARCSSCRCARRTAGCRRWRASTGIASRSCG